MRPGIVAWLLSVALLAWSAFSLAEAPYQEGKQYERLPIPVDTRDPHKVEVIEVFSYACIHCKNFHDTLVPWVKKQPAYVDFYRMPATFNPSWEALAQLYYTAEALGVTDKVHWPIFQAIHDRGVNLTDPDLAAKLFQQVAGVPPDKFHDVYKSFSVRSRVQQATARSLAYRVTGTPTMIVDGIYRVDGQMAGSNEAMLDVVDYLVAKRHAEMTSNGASDKSSSGDGDSGDDDATEGSAPQGSASEGSTGGGP